MRRQKRSIPEHQRQSYRLRALETSLGRKATPNEIAAYAPPARDDYTADRAKETPGEWGVISCELACAATRLRQRGALVVLMILASRRCSQTGRIMIKRREITKLTGLHRSIVSKAIIELYHQGFIDYLNEGGSCLNLPLE